MIRIPSTVLSAVVLSFSLGAASQVARADEKEAASHPPARILSAAQDGAGNHAVLLRNASGKTEALVGTPGHMQSLEILSVDRAKDSFAVDTLEKGMIIFHTREARVIFPGEVGFNAKNPTRVYNRAPEPDVKIASEARLKGSAGEAGHGVRGAHQQLELQGRVSEPTPARRGLVRAMLHEHESARGLARRSSSLRRAGSTRSSYRARRVRARTTARRARR